MSRMFRSSQKPSSGTPCRRRASGRMSVSSSTARLGRAGTRRASSGLWGPLAGCSASIATRMPSSWPPKGLRRSGSRFGSCTGTSRSWGRTDAVVYDFGLSSMHVDRPERGFSYQHDAPLDMRMDPTQPLSAYDVVNTYDERHLSQIIRSYGEERWAARIAEFIVAARKRRPIATTKELVEVIRAAVPSAARRVGPHPARRTFQALRLEVNKELEAIQTSLPQARAELSPGGRLVALSYHSGEDRLVKRFMREEASGEAPRLRLLTKKPERPSEEEIAINPRASAARLRAAERLAAPPEPDGPPGGHAA
jgi:16S rRNA (cytosine(1402)-N(4))-methyltransferase